MGISKISSLKKSGFFQCYTLLGLLSCDSFFPSHLSLKSGKKNADIFGSQMESGRVHAGLTVRWSESGI